MARKIISQELKDKIIEEYKSKPMSLETLEARYDLSHPTISKILSGIPKYAKATIYNPELKEDFFENIDCEEKAYFLGLLIADGNVFIDDKDNRQASISITLDSGDEYLLETFRALLKINTSITHDGRGCSQIAIRSNKMAQSLEKYGVIPRKSFDTYLPRISDDLMPHLLRGILDGDGSIKAKQTNIRGRYAHAISYCGTHRLMCDIADWCIANNIKNPIVYDYKNRCLSELKLQSVDSMYKFGEMLYINATIYMKRKKDAYDKFKQHYNL